MDRWGPYVTGEGIVVAAQIQARSDLEMQMLGLEWRGAICRCDYPKHPEHKLGRHQSVYTHGGSPEHLRSLGEHKPSS